MGYRHRIYEFDKALVEKIRACKTKNDLIEVISKTNPDAYEYYDEEENYIQLYRLGKELFNFGSYYENASEMYKHGDSLFLSDELNEEFSDEKAIVLDKEGLLCAIEWQKEKIISIYEDLLKDDYKGHEDDLVERYQHQSYKLQRHVEDHLRWWKPEWGDFCAYNLNENTDSIVRSWLYEHTIFELVRIYKSFDWENKRMIFMGW